MKPALYTTTLSRRLVAAGLLLATVAWRPGALDADRTELSRATGDNVTVRTINTSGLPSVSPELPWFLKPADDPQRAAQTRMRTLSNMRRQVKFTENRGQVTDEHGQSRQEVLYYGGVSTAQIYLTRNTIGYAFYAEAGAPTHDDRGRRISATDRPDPKRHVVEMEIVGAREDVRIETAQPTPGVYNFIKGQPDEWITGVASYQKLIYHNIYDRIDMVVESQGSGLKYDFVVHPGGDPGRIRLRHTGIEKVSVNDEGKLRIETAVGVIEENVPYSYQAVGEEVPNAYFVDRKGIVSFNLGSYDPTRTLTIDPTVLWSTFFGGNGSDVFNDVEIISDGTFVAVGTSSSTSIPRAASAPATGLGIAPNSGQSGSSDGIIARFNEDCELLWYTFFGGSQADEINSVEIDGNYVYVMGTAISTPGQGFPISAANVPQSAKNNASRDQFVACFSMSTGARMWSSYRGGTGTEYGLRISVRTISDATNGTRRVIAGVGTTTGNYPTGPNPAINCGGGATVPIQAAYPGGTTSATVFRWIERHTTGTPNGAEQIWSSYLGGAATDEATAVELDAAGTMYIGGSTESLSSGQGGSFPARNGGNSGVNTSHSISAGSQTDGFMGRFDSTGCLMCLGYFGGTGNDDVTDGGFDDGASTMYLTGRTISDGFSGTSALPAGIGQSTRGSSTAADAFLAKFGSNCVLDCATYHGGSAEDRGEDIDVVENSMARRGTTTILICGSTQSTNMPVSPGDNQCSSLADPLTGGGSHRTGGTVPATINDDFFIACFSSTCCRLWSTYWGGDNDDQAFGISATVVDGKDRVVVGGITYSDGANGTLAYPTQAGPGGGNFFQAAMTATGQPDATLLKFEFAVDEKLSIDLSSFGGVVEKSIVRLNWRTASEEQNAGFELRRAELDSPYDDVHFRPVSSYLTNNSLLGLGTSPIGKSYEYVDDDPALTPGKLYVYQLVDIGTDGVRTTHPNLMVRIEGSAAVQTHDLRVDPLVPNPATESISVSFGLRNEEMVTVEIYSMDGRKLATPIAGHSYPAGNYVQKFSVDALPPGVYTAVVSTGNFQRVRTRQFVVAR